MISRLCMRRFSAGLTAGILTLALTAGCGVSGSASQGTQNTAADASAMDSGGTGNKLRIVTTIFPEYDWTRNIIGDNADDVELTMLLENGVDLHSYQPTAEDILTISGCDLFIYVGGESSKWVTDALKEAPDSDMVVVNLLEVIGEDAREEELVEGMQKEDGEHGTSSGNQSSQKDSSSGDTSSQKNTSESADSSKGSDADYDEHIWLSLKNAEKCVNAIAEAVSSLDPEHSGEYAANARAYLEKLDSLDKEYEAAVSEASVKTLLFGDRFPFRYLTDDYGLSYYAAFAGCSAETEASFETIIFLAKKVDELGLKCVLTIDNSDGKIAKTIVQNTKSGKQKILTLDSMQSVSSGEMPDGPDYLSVMESNLDVLREALA